MDVASFVLFKRCDVCGDFTPADRSRCLGCGLLFFSFPEKQKTKNI